MLNYRWGGWPGVVSAKLKSGSRLFDSNKFWNIIFKLRFFTPNRCMLCHDALNELADISFGDPWLPELKNERVGRSLIVARSKKGEDLLQQAISNGKIELNSVHSNKVKQSQGSIYYKKRILRVTIFLYKLFNKKTPIYNSKMLKPKLIDYLISMLFCLNAYASSKWYMWRILHAIVSLARFMYR
jgi:coenzyme F420 hydrogenase subunit beta